MTPYLRTPQGWARLVRIDPARGPICEPGAPLDDRGIPGAGKCSPMEFVAAGAAMMARVRR